MVVGNLPKLYTTDDVSSLVQEVNPLFISDFNETRVLNLKFCQIGLSEKRHKEYLIRKLDNFVIKGTKLIAFDVDQFFK
ncbi:hypothetical protein RUM44_013961 [Polyplax serrata]|uniref:Uncharacterized protein n=1 Tax=Polyplax serrata TaxID=468196 RepID=A0ABR1BFM3_POLSC